MNKIKLGFAICGSFCTHAENVRLMETLAGMDYDILPILSFNAARMDTRFGKARELIEQVESICGKKVICSIEAAEPIGPKHMTDILLVSPCTGNTLAKLAYSIIDTPVTMAVKSHLRNHLPVVLAVSTNDALSGCAKNIGTLSNYRNFYFVPLAQDNFRQKPTSLVAKFDLAPQTIEAALQGIQIEPVLLSPHG